MSRGLRPALARLVSGLYPASSAASPSMSELFVSNLCASLPRYPLPDSAEELEQALLHANEAMPSCLRNADFFAWRGALQMALAQYTNAAEPLEPRLADQPRNLPAAQLDYAQVLFDLVTGNT